MIYNYENAVGIGQLNPSPMRRDYYRGSQDSLAVRGKFLLLIFNVIILLLMCCFILNLNDFLIYMIFQHLVSVLKINIIPRCPKLSNFFYHRIKENNIYKIELNWA